MYRVFLGQHSDKPGDFRWKLNFNLNMRYSVLGGQTYSLQTQKITGNINLNFHAPVAEFLLAATMFFGAFPAHAETIPSASQLLPSSNSAAPALATSDMQLRGANDVVVPPGAIGNTMKIGDVTIEGLAPQFSTEVEALIAQMRGQELPISDVYGVAGQIQKLYADEGWFLTRVVIPPQHVKDGKTINLKVIEGFIADINVESLPPQVRERVLRYFAPLKGKSGVKLPVFQRALLLASGTNGLKLKTNLKPSDEALGVTLTVTGDYDPLSGQLVTDNGLSESLGTYSTTFSLALNSPFNLGEQFYLSLTGSPTHNGLDVKSPRRVFATGVTVPLADNGLSGNLEYTWSNTKPIVSGTGLATTSQYRRVSAKVTYPVMLDQTTTLNARLGFDDIDELNRASEFDYTLYHDHINVLRAGLDYNRTFLGGIQLFGGLDASQGISGLWSRGAAEALSGDALSQSGASDRFTKLQARLRLYQEYANGLAWDVSARGQYSPTGRLLNAEKFVIGGTGDLSGSDSGGWSGDHGWSVRAEMQFNAASYLQTPGLGAKPYLFAARGQVYTQNPTASEIAMDGATGFGIGLRGQWAAPKYPTNPIDFALEAARNLSDHPDRNPSEWRLNMSVGVRF